jgi:hypothetical protein
MLSLTESLRKLSIGRIVFCVFAAAPVGICLGLLLNPGATHDDELGNGILLLLMLILDIPILLAGIAILIWQIANRKDVLFWSVAVFIALTPMIALLGMITANRLSHFKIPG